MAHSKQQKRQLIRYITIRLKKSKSSADSCLQDFLVNVPSEAQEVLEGDKRNIPTNKRDLTSQHVRLRLTAINYLDHVQLESAGSTTY